ncbi:MAG: type II secretion system protein N [Proteobacteria bacterium]|nr:type II secretion system protein N [Pseudomonadota bacterium]
MRPLASARPSAGRSSGFAWAVVGLLIGALVATVCYAPASWLADAVASATRQRVLLADARGTVWDGDAIAVLTAGPDSRDAASLPGRLSWTLGLAGTDIELRARHACCLNGTVVLRLHPGIGRYTATLVPPPGWVAQWPSAVLAGLGTPFNTLRLGGMVRLLSPGLTVESAQGRVGIAGSAEVELLHASSRLATLDELGSYRLTLSAAPKPGSGASRLQLATEEGALILQGNGSWEPGGTLYFRGEARAATPDDEAKLSNLLNIIGRRNGARSIISIG